MGVGMGMGMGELHHLLANNVGLLRDMYLLIE